MTRMEVALLTIVSLPVRSFRGMLVAPLPVAEPPVKTFFRD